MNKKYQKKSEKNEIINKPEQKESPELIAEERRKRNN